MIVGVGIDVVEVTRMRQVLTRHGERARKRLFTEMELSTCDGRADWADCFAARFAAKEAALKALGSGKVPGVRWTDFEVERATSGKPALELQGEAKARADELGVDRIWLSLSHEGGFACAIVVLES